jgi:hypothetical protein
MTNQNTRLRGNISAAVSPVLIPALAEVKALLDHQKRFLFPAQKEAKA